MPTPLFTLAGMISGQQAIAVDEVLDHAVIDSEGRLLVSMVDLLAIVRLDRDADILLVEFVDGASRAFRLADVLEHGNVFIRLGIDAREGSGDDAWLARLWSQDVGDSAVVVSIRATTFATFVGSS